jgi:PPOX class probable FMN-dependent enzyme
MTGEDDTIRTVEALEELYGTPPRRSLVKETDHITKEYRAWIEASPFAVLASAGPEGLDCSPRGDPAPVVSVLDEKTVLLADRLGNNRVDTLRNIVRDPRVALLFLLPGVGEAIRINGRAIISVAPDLLDRFVVAGRPPRSVIVVSVDSVYFQCARAVIRAGLWDAAQHVDRKSLPSMGEIIAALESDPFDAKAYDAELPDRQKRTLY